LVHEDQHCFQGKLAEGLVEEGFERGAHEIHD
jgi:hypothetical protein